MPKVYPIPYPKYSLPPFVSAAADTNGGSEYFGYGIGYTLGMIDIGYVKEATNTAENTYAGVGATFGDLSIGVDTSNRDNGAAAAAPLSRFDVSTPIERSPNVAPTPA